MDASKLEGAALDLAVMIAEGWEKAIVEPGDDFACGAPWKLIRSGVRQPVCWECTPHAFSTDWAHGGPIIQRERIEITPTAAGWYAAVDPHKWYSPAVISKTAPDGEGPTPLIAAMRAFVASRQ